jgi:hypothetical protein
MVFEILLKDFFFGEVFLKGQRRAKYLGECPYGFLE